MLFLPVCKIGQTECLSRNNYHPIYFEGNYFWIEIKNRQPINSREIEWYMFIITMDNSGYITGLKNLNTFLMQLNW